MINLLSALTLTAKLGICIAVFAVLIVAEILALVMLVKWKKNYKSAAVNKDSADTQNTLEETPQSVREEAAENVSAELSEESKNEENADLDAQEPVAEDLSAETAQLDDVADDPVQDESADDAEASQEDVVSQEEVNQDETEQDEEVKQDEDKQDDVAQPSENKWSAFAFAPLMLLSATAQATSLRYILYVLIGVSVVLAAAVLATAVIFSKSLTKAPKEESAQQPAQEPVEETAKEEPQPIVEEEVEEPVVEEEVAEQVEEPIEEQLADEELTAEEVEEPVVEEEQIIEEQPIEEEPPIVEEAVVEEEQPIIEEPAKEEPKPRVKRPPVPREQTMVVDDVQYIIKDDRFLFNPQDDGWYILLEKTFTAKLIQADEYVKDYYTEIKNELLSYKKVHARMSRKRESFNFGRVCLARMTIRGKTLRLHLALDAKDYEETKYKVEDTSQIKSLADTPLMYRIKNDRRLKYTKDLIAAVMAQYGVEKEEIQPVDYTSMYPYEETPPLIERRLIIQRRVKGKVPEGNGFDFAQKTFKAKLIQSDEIVKEYYSHLKNELLAHRKVHDRMSKKRESFRFGRECVARMSIRGKTLKLYLALNPQDYVDTKYKFEDVSDVKSYADTPFMMKIKNPRRLKYAMELIDVVMANVGATLKRDLHETDYVADLPFESTEELMEKGLVVNVHVKGNSFVAQHFSFKAKDEDAEDEVASDEDND